MYHIYWFAGGTAPKFHTCNNSSTARLYIDNMLKNAPLLHIYTFRSDTQVWFYDYVHSKSERNTQFRCPADAAPSVFRTLNMIGV